MKKKKVFSKVLAIVLVLSLMLTTFPSFSAFAQETSSKEQLTEKGELWQPESNSNALNFEGDLSIEELQSAKLNDEDTPEIVGQDNIEEKGHVNRLWEQEEDLNSIVFQNRDGTKTMYYYNYPVKYKDANGKIKDKSNKISQTSSGDYTNAENDINTYFPKKINRNKGIELKFGEYVVEMAPDIKGNSGASRQTGHNKYFDPTEYVQYPNVFDEGISLRYTPTFEGYKEDIVLSEYTGINEFSFRLYTGGLSLVMNEDGSYYLIDPLSGEIKTQIGDLVVYDSKPFDVPDEILNESVSNPTEEDFAKKEATLKELIESVPIDKNATEELPTNLKESFHQYKVETVKQDNEYIITIVVDEEYLTDSERVYPVYVDPTLSVETFSTDGTKNIMDAPIYANKPSTASGGNTYNVVGYQGSTYGVGRTLMKFPGLSSNSTYKNLKAEQITNLQLHIYEGSGSTNNACIDLWQYNGTSWTESTARCNNVGWDNYYNNFTWNFINCSGWQTFNLTSMVATWKSGGTGVGSPLDKGIIMTNYTSEYSSAYSKHFMSTESSYKPYLTYSYVTNIPVSQVCLEPSSLSLNVNDTYYLDGSVVPYNATNQTIYYESSNTSVANVGYTSGLVCASSPGTTTITARSAADGSKYATCVVNVQRYYCDRTQTLQVGMSADSYANDTCSYGARVSIQCANAFWYAVGSNLYDRNLKFYHYNNGNVHSSVYATKRDFLSKSFNTISHDNIDDVDIMVYVGHGLTNSGMHFTQGSNGYQHSVDKSSHTISELNFSISEAKFGYGDARTKWVVAYTCNFLNHSLNEMKPMMQGVNIVLGYSTTSYLIDEQMELFGIKLDEGETIIDAWFASSTKHHEYADFDATMAAVYVDDAENDTIYRYLGDTKTYLDETISYITHSAPGKS